MEAGENDGRRLSTATLIFVQINLCAHASEGCIIYHWMWSDQGFHAYSQGTSHPLRWHCITLAHIICESYPRHSIMRHWEISGGLVSSLFGGVRHYVHVREDMETWGRASWYCTVQPGSGSGAARWNEIVILVFLDFVGILGQSARVHHMGFSMIKKCFSLHVFNDTGV